MTRGLFITGTDTNVGKTLFSSVLASDLLRTGEPVGYWKPAQTGEDSDRSEVLRLSGLAERHSPPSLHSFPEPMAPSRAARLHSTRIELPKLLDAWGEIRHEDQFWIVEGAGGLLVPLSERLRIIELAVALRLPLIVVANPRLGTMNHILLTLEAARARALSVAALVISGSEDPGLEEALAPWAQDVPITLRMPTLATVSPAAITALAAELRPCERIRHGLG